MAAKINAEALNQLKQLITTREQLEAYFRLSDSEASTFDLLAQEFRMSITPYYLGLIDRRDPMDPIRLQCIPQAAEMIRTPGASFEDPLAEDQHMPVPFLVHRYPDRVLFLLTDKCAVYCRHCTRKRWTSQESRPSQVQLESMIQYIAERPSIRDVLVSGGDPLLAGPGRLFEVLDKLHSIDHLDIIRLGTRVPVVLPHLLDADFCQNFRRYDRFYINTHFNHPREVTALAHQALSNLANAGVVLGNQTVLLKGVNDNIEVLKELFLKLLRARCRPYYLLQCDPVKGTEHFRTPLSVGVDIIGQLRGQLTGLAIPKFIVDLPGGGGKIELTPDRFDHETADATYFTNSQGKVFGYPKLARQSTVTLEG